MQPDSSVNHRVVLASRPSGLPVPEDFRIETTPRPAPRDGQVLLRTLYLSLDPYMRQVMNEIAPLYAPSVELGSPMPGGTVSRVVASRHSGFSVGDLVLANAGWQEYAVSDGTDLQPLGEMRNPSLALGGLGMPAFTAYVGLLDIGKPQPGETVVVAAATGAVGSVVGQIARIKAARVVGVAGGDDKCRYAVAALGFDACIDRHAPDFVERLAAACPAGIDVYFENVGGPVFDAVFPLLNIGARVPVCGVIAHYNEESSRDAANGLARLLTMAVQKRIHLQGFVILDHYGARFDAFQREMNAWIANGDIKFREDVAEGLGQAPAAFIRLLQGRNFGKAVVRIAEH